MKHTKNLLLILTLLQGSFLFNAQTSDAVELNCTQFCQFNGELGVDFVLTDCKDRIEDEVRSTKNILINYLTDKIKNSQEQTSKLEGSKPCPQCEVAKAVSPRQDKLLDSYQKVQACYDRFMSYKNGIAKKIDDYNKERAPLVQEKLKIDQANNDRERSLVLEQQISEIDKKIALIKTQVSASSFSKTNNTEVELTTIKAKIESLKLK